MALANTALIDVSFRCGYSPPEGNLRAMRRSEIEKTLQVPEAWELLTTLSNVTERAGFRDDIGLCASLRVEPACCRYASGVFSSPCPKVGSTTERAGFEPAVQVCICTMTAPKYHRIIWRQYVRLVIDTNCIDYVRTF